MRYSQRAVLGGVGPGSGVPPSLADVARSVRAGAVPRAAVFVEGVSDRAAVLAMARRRGRDLTAEDVAVVALGGVTNIRSFLRVFGPAGADVQLAGLCDEGEVAVYQRALRDAGFAVTAVPELEEHGFFVCSADLEEELIRAVGPAVVEEVIDSEGELGSFRTLQKQAAQQGRTHAAQLHRFMGSRGGRKTRYAQLLVDRLDLQRAPRALDGVLDHVRPR